MTEEIKEDEVKEVKKLEIVNIEYFENSITKVSWDKFVPGEEKESGVWEFDGPTNRDQVLEHAKTKVDKDFEVSLNLK